MKENNPSEFTINELIVVEGKNDAHAIRLALGKVDVIWTEGFGLTEDKIDMIAKMAQRQGVIVCTDPDYAGELIRKKISRRVPGVHHVYISRSNAKNAKGNDIGWENVSVEEIRQAFRHIRREPKPSAAPDNRCQVKTAPQNSDIIQMRDLVEAGLAGAEGAADKRSKIGKILGLGDTNAKQFVFRANRYGISKKDFLTALERLKELDG